MSKILSEVGMSSFIF